VDLPHGIQRAAVWPIGILFWLQVGLEYRFEQPTCRRQYPGRSDGNLFAHTIPSSSAFPEAEAGRPPH